MLLQFVEVKKVFKGVIAFAHEIIEKAIKQGEVAIDATCGNGNDTLLLSNITGASGHVYAFDVQAQAIENTRKLIAEKGLFQNVTYIHDSHERIDDYVKEAEIAGAIFNLGYLPRSDKTIITKPDSTLTALEKILAKLKSGGVAVLVVYSGHPGGKEESEAVLNYVQQLDQEHFIVLAYQFINLRNNPPYTLAIYKK